MTASSPTRTANGDRPERSHLDLPEATVAVVGDGPAGDRTAGIIEAGGGRAIRLTHCGQFAALGDAAALGVFVSDALAEATRWLEPARGADEGQPVIAICTAIRPGDMRNALARGISGVVLAEALSSSLLPCIAAVLSGQVCVPRSQSRQVDAAHLSAREKQILGLVVMGYMNSEIADQLVVAESTVKSHLSSAFGKLGVRSRHEAVDLILDTERGLGMGILSLGGEPITEGGGAPG